MVPCKTAQNGKTLEECLHYVSYSAKMTQEILVHNINKSQMGQVRTSKITSKIPY